MYLDIEVDATTKLPDANEADNEIMEISIEFSFNKRFTQEINESLMSRGISTNGLTKNEKYRLYTFTDYYNNDYFELMSQFMKYMDENKIKKNDVTSYSSLEEIRSAVGLATMNELNKELEGQLIKEYEDERFFVTISEGTAIEQMAKCDQLDGVIKFLQDWNIIEE